MKHINVLFLASEADPLVKVGGLGDVAGSLPHALDHLPPEKLDGRSVDVRLVIPFHAVIRDKISDPEFLFEFEVPTREGAMKAQAFHLELNGVQTYLIGGAPFGERATVYTPDAAVDGVKYTFFSLAALEFVRKLGWKPDILHANDWHTALAVYALKLRKPADPFFRHTHSVISVHNLPFMGAGTEQAFELFDLPESRYPRMPWWAKKFPLPLGLQTADHIIAVSPTYAREILTPEYGCGLEGILNARKRVVSGIVNGLDVESWDPARDATIPVNFDADSLAKRAGNKTALAQEFELDPDPKIPLLILISRMDQQKGVDLAVEGLAKSLGLKWQAILLGNGDPKLEQDCRDLEAAHPERVRAAIRFDGRLARRMYAGADILLMPSRYEPCGLAQMMAMRYGCAPLARATGGLVDTIHDMSASLESGTGFLFGPATAQAFAGALERAVKAFPKKKAWQEMQLRGMRQDFSWEKSALLYLEHYEKLKRR